MSIRVMWVPNMEPDIASYDLEAANDLTPAATWRLVGNVVHDFSGPHYDATAGKFFLVDSAGFENTHYRLFAYDVVGLRSVASTPFKAASGNPAIFNRVRVDHNYPTPTSLRYQTAGGVPIEGATVRLFLKADFDMGRTASALATTTTDARGEWVSPVFLTTGFTYKVYFSKEGLYGPDTREIVV